MTANKMEDNLKNAPKSGNLTSKDVLKVAARLIRTHGYHGTSTQMIADALGISKSTLFHHIKNKQQMLFAILNDPLNKIFPNIQDVYKREITSLEKLKIIVNTHIINLLENIEVAGVLLHEENYLEQQYKEIIEPTRDSYVETFRKVIEEGIENGEFRRVDPKMVTFAILGMCNSLIHWYNPEGKIAIEEIANMYTDYAISILMKADV